MRSSMWWLCALSALLVLSGCQSIPTVEERTAAARALATGAGMTPLTTASPLPLRGYLRAARVGAPLVVYIEGDGRAWVSAHTPSPDPTPVNPVALQLAVIDRAENVVYLARPGQYSVDGTDRRYWLSARFSAEVVDSYLVSIRELARELAAPAIHLVGFSGGGAIAVLVADRLQASDMNTTRLTVRTVGGNLDIEAWTRMLRLTPLSGSLNPADVAARLVTVPQRHLIGLRDRQVPRAVLDAYLARLPDRGCVEVVEVDVGHGGPWQDAWSRALAPPQCGGEPGIGSR